MCFPSVEKKHLRHLLLSLYNKTSPSVETLKNLVWLISPGMVVKRPPKFFVSIKKKKKRTLEKLAKSTFLEIKTKQNLLIIQVVLI